MERNKGTSKPSDKNSNEQGSFEDFLLDIRSMVKKCKKKNEARQKKDSSQQNSVEKTKTVTANIQDENTEDWEWETDTEEAMEDVIQRGSKMEERQKKAKRIRLIQKKTKI